MSKHSEHTPGPWKIAATFAREIISGSCIVATPRRAHSPGSQFCPTDDSTVEANARLIAAAPDMLDLISFVRDMLDRHLANGDTRMGQALLAEDLDDIDERVRALLAKVEGRQ